METQEINELADFALTLARASERQTLAHFRQPVKIHNKLDEGFDPVTEGDRGAERIMRELIEARYPGHCIHGEEFGVKDTGSAYKWVLDPIDGTRSFIAGTMTWTTLIGLEYEGKPVIGVMHQPYVAETFLGTPEGAFVIRANTREQIRVNPADDLAGSFGTTTSQNMYKSARQKRVLERFQTLLRNVRYDADAYFFALLAAGHIDIALDAGLQPYDIAPLVPIIEGAGGIVSTWDGKPAKDGGDIIAAASQRLYDEAVEKLLV